MREKRDKLVLIQASSHLFYEYSMFISLANCLISGIAGQSYLHNALLESFIVHGRNLVDFFYKIDSIKPDDMIADDYFQNTEEWSNKCPLKTENIEIIKKRTGKEVAHLSYKRIDVKIEEKSWPIGLIANDLHNIMNIFVHSVSSDLLASEWDLLRQQLTDI